MKTCFELLPPERCFLWISFPQFDCVEAVLKVMYYERLKTTFLGYTEYQEAGDNSFFKKQVGKVTLVLQGTRSIRPLKLFRYTVNKSASTSGR